MPIYVYECDSCRTVKERIEAKPREHICCGKVMRRKVTAPASIRGCPTTDKPRYQD